MRFVFLVAAALLQFGGRAALASEHSLTSFGDFKPICVLAAQSYAPRAEDGRLLPVWDTSLGEDCAEGRPALHLGITHESARNSHAGSKNFDPMIASYVADFDYAADFGRWIDFRIRNAGRETVFSLVLDTINYDTVNVTGWPVRYGHLFAALSDTTVQADLEEESFVEFDIRVTCREYEKGPNEAYAGQRIMVGFLADWNEAPPRTNQKHFYEVDLFQGDGYSESYGEKLRPLCSDRNYDRCFYDPAGRWAEGREIRFDGESAIGNIGSWTHVTLAVGQGFRSLDWVSKPQSWARAKLRGLYIGVESTGAARTCIELRNYRLYSLK